MRCAALVGANTAVPGRTTQRGGVARNHYCAGPLFDHVRRQRSGEIKQGGRVDPEIFFQLTGVGLKERLERGGDGVVHEDRGIPHLRTHAVHGRDEGIQVADVAYISFCPGNFGFQGREAALVAGQHGDAVPALGEPAGQRGAGAVADASD